MNKDLMLPAGILGLAIVLSTALASYTFYAVKTYDDTLSVTGSTKERVTADIAKWSITANRVVYENQVASAYEQVAADSAKIKKFLTDSGVEEASVTVTPIFVDDFWGPEQVRKLNVRQVTTVEGKDVEKIRELSSNTVVLAQQGVSFSPSAPEYTVSTLPELRVQLLGKAVEDARARAGEIAKSTGRSVGRLTSASSGVVQVLQPNSIEVADYGAYDTSTVEKDVMVTVRVTFRVR